jgi:hypothetical protein
MAEGADSSPWSRPRCVYLTISSKPSQTVAQGATDSCPYEHAYPPFWTPAQRDAHKLVQSAAAADVVHDADDEGLPEEGDETFCVECGRVCGPDERVVQCGTCDCCITCCQCDVGECDCPTDSEDEAREALREMDGLEEGGESDSEEDEDGE